MNLLTQHMLLYSVSAVVLTGITLLFLRYLSAKIGHRVTVWILLLLAVRILIPTGFHGIVTLPDTAGNTQGEVLILPESQLSDMPGENALWDNANQTVPLSQSHTAYILLAVWIAGALIFLFIQLAKQLPAFWHQKSRAQQPSEALLVVYGKAVQRMGLKKYPRLAVLDEDIVPHFCGILHPVIYMGRQTLTKEEQFYILCHELTHYKRKDTIAKLFLLLTLSAFWWNPLVYYFVRFTEQEMECACDEEVLAGCSNKERLLYGGTILQVMKSSQTVPAFLSADFGKPDSNLKRFEMLLDNRKKQGGGLVLGVFLVLFCISGIMFGCAKTETQTEKPIVFYVASEETQVLTPQKLMVLVQDMTVPSKIGHVHSGWRVENIRSEEGGYSIRFEPVYSVGTYAVTMVYHEEKTETKTLNFGESLPVPTRKGYIFGGWYTDEALQHPVSTVPATDSTLYAKWILE